MNWLEVDQGNSRIKWRFRCHDEIVDEGVSISPSELAHILTLRGRVPHRLALASVQGTQALAEWEASFVHCRPWLVTTRPAVAGLKVAYQDHRKLGVDRWLAMLAAVRSFPGEALVVIDAGTALTVDVIDHLGQHLGGIIVPGIGLMARAVNEGLTQVQADVNVPGTFLGRSTSECVRAGLWSALSGAVEKTLREVALPEVGRVLVTGGDASILSELVQLPCHLTLRQNLVLDGVYHARREEFGP